MAERETLLSQFPAGGDGKYTGVDSNVAEVEPGRRLPAVMLRTNFVDRVNRRYRENCSYDFLDRVGSGEELFEHSAGPERVLQRVSSLPRHNHKGKIPGLSNALTRSLDDVTVTCTLRDESMVRCRSLPCMAYEEVSAEGGLSDELFSLDDYSDSVEELFVGTRQSAFPQSVGTEQSAFPQSVGTELSREQAFGSFELVVGADTGLHPGYWKGVITTESKMQYQGRDATHIIKLTEGKSTYSSLELTGTHSEGTTNVNIPEWFSRIATLTNCSHNGKVFYDDNNGFGLEIPEGAIPEQESITIDIGVALYGPFAYPEGLKPVSPVFWVCARESKLSNFLKPVSITIPHCLNVESSEDINSLDLTFLKGEHEVNSQQLYQFQEVEASEMLFEAKKAKGTLKTTHFCCKCIAGKVSQELIKQTMFCIYAVIPPAVMPLQKTYCHFFVLYLLPTCIETVEKRITNVMGLKLEQDPSIEEFSFTQDDPALEIILPDSTSTEWKIGVQGKIKIFPKDVDFITAREDLLKLKEQKGMYPPRFKVVISCSPAARHGQAKIQFKGATTELVYDIPLIPKQSPAAPSNNPPIGDTAAAPTASTTGRTGKLGDIAPVKDILVKLSKNELKDLFRDLGLSDETVENNYAGSEKCDYLDTLIYKWKRGDDKVLDNGEPTWENLKKALIKKGHSGIARDI